MNSSDDMFLFLTAPPPGRRKSISSYDVERTPSIDVHDNAAVGHLCVHFHCDPNTLDEIGTTPPVPGKGVKGFANNQEIYQRGFLQKIKKSRNPEIKKSRNQGIKEFLGQGNLQGNLVS